MRKDPIFITGVYRSGTSYLSRILDAHSELNITYDSVNFFRFVIRQNLRVENYQEIVKSIADRLKSRIKKIIDVKRILKEIESSDELSYRVIYDAVLRAYFDFSDKRWGEKTLMEWTNIPTFFSWYPQGKAIHIIRDPRDVMASYREMTIETGLKYMDSVFANMHSIDSAYKYQELFPKDRFYLVKYEDLIQDTGNIINDICNFLEIPFEDSILDETNYKDIVGKSFEKTTHSSFPKSKELPMNRWQKKCSKIEIDFVEGIMSKQLDLAGYKKSSQFSDNNISKFIDLLQGENLLKERFVNYLQTGEGVESFPSNPIQKENWGGDLVGRGQGAAAAYGKSKE